MLQDFFRISFFSFLFLFLSFLSFLNYPLVWEGKPRKGQVRHGEKPNSLRNCSQSVMPRPGLVELQLELLDNITKFVALGK